tara:strand:+ start:1683 stop:1916 length:234 start_codon:yes stop_codon:yes gene_type:complete
MKNYTHLTLSQRYQIKSLLQVRISQTNIASILEVDKSTISRELKRNVAKQGGSTGVYKAEKTQSKTMIRHVTILTFY